MNVFEFTKDTQAQVVERHTSRLSVLVASLSLIAFSADAHDFTLVSDGGYIGEPPDISTAVELPEGVSDSIIDSYKIWDTGSTLAFCFMDGSVQSHSFFVEVASRWVMFANLDFDFGNVQPDRFRSCGPDNVSDIRVSFAEPGNWSYVGTDALRAETNSPTLNVGTMISSPRINRNRRLAGTIMHEVGHAIGLLHEHQRNDAPCEAEINWESVYQILGSAPNNWSKEKVDDNLRSFVLSERHRFTAYDQNSIMHYATPKDWFLNWRTASCFVEKNNEISDADIALVRAMYPQNASEQVAYFDANEQEVADQLRNSGIDSTELADLADMLRMLLPENLQAEAGQMEGLDVRVSSDIVRGDLFKDISVTQTVTGDNNKTIGFSIGAQPETDEN